MFLDDGDDALKMNVSYKHPPINLCATAIVHSYLFGLLGKYLYVRMTLNMHRSAQRCQSLKIRLMILAKKISH